MKKQMGLFVLLLLMARIIFPSHEVEASTMEYTVRANLPDNQIDDRLTYFYLRMQPGKTQELSLTVENTSNEVIELMIEPNTAITNQQGVIDYSQHEIEKDSSLTHAFSDLISERKHVRVEANETKEVTFTLNMPEEVFDGIILGGFHIFQVNVDESEQTGMIKNRFAFVIGVKLRITDTEVQPDLTLNEVQSALINYRTAVTANLQNIKATMVGNLEVIAQITRQGSQEILHEATRTGLSMAPNSNFDFPISWNNQPLEAGRYRLYLTATNGDQTWEFERDFEIEAEVVSELNSEAVELETGRNLTLLYIVMSVIATVSVMLVLGLWMKKRNERKENEK